MKIKIRIPKRLWTLVYLLLIGLIAWTSAGIVNGVLANKIDVISPPTMQKPGSKFAKKAFPAGQEDFSYIIRRNIFNSAQAPGDAEKFLQKASLEAVGDNVAAPKTTLNLKLVGTVIDAKGDYRLAVIEVGGGDNNGQRLFRPNDTVSGATIAKIERDRVLLNRGGVIEALVIDFTKPRKKGLKSLKRGMKGSGRAEVTKVSKGEYVVSKQYIQSQLNNMNRLLTQVRAVPNVDKSGAANGFKLFSVRKGSIFNKIGLKNRDVVQRINGVNLDSAEKGLELFQALRNETSFEVDILRNSRKTTLRFNVQ